MPRKPKPPGEKKNKGGRPCTYTTEHADAIISSLEEGEMLRAICKRLGLRVRTVMQWCEDDHEGFATRYARARQAGWDGIAEEMIEIADRADKDTANAVRVQVDTRKWLLSKLSPQKYGDRLDVGGNGLIGFVAALRAVGAMLQGKDESPTKLIAHTPEEDEP